MKKQLISIVTGLSILASGFMGTEEVKASEPIQETYTQKAINARCHTYTVTLPVGSRVYKSTTYKSWFEKNYSYIDYQKLPAGKCKKRVRTKIFYIKRADVHYVGKNVTKVKATGYTKVYFGGEVTTPTPSVDLNKIFTNAITKSAKLEHYGVYEVTSKPFYGDTLFAVKASKDGGYNNWTGDYQDSTIVSALNVELAKLGLVATTHGSNPSQNTGYYLVEYSAKPPGTDGWNDITVKADFDVYLDKSGWTLTSAVYYEDKHAIYVYGVEEVEERFANENVPNYISKTYLNGKRVNVEIFLVDYGRIKTYKYTWE